VHNNDAIIECSDKNFDAKIEPAAGTVRLVSSFGAPASSKNGRLEVFLNGNWGSVCNTGFGKLEA